MNWKRFTALVLSALMLLSLFGCGKKAETLDVSCDYLLARTEAKKTAKMSEAADENLAMRVSRIETHLGLD